MSQQIKSFLAAAGAIGMAIGIFFGIIHLQNTRSGLSAQNERASGIGSQGGAFLAIANIPVSATSSLPAKASAAAGAVPSPSPQKTSDTSATSSQGTEKPAVSGKVKKETTQAAPENKQAIPTATENEEAQNSATIRRLENPYPFPPQSFEIINEQSRLALVNIVCATKGGSLKSTSGSGVIIDPRGVILTNAHVAQYVLLSSDSRLNLACFIRAGSPAREKWTAEVLYIPPVWVREHASEIRSARAVSTGEHDYALLRIIGSIDGTPLPAAFPYLPVDVREAIGFLDDPVLVASYPAEFIGGITSQFNLYPASTITNIKDLLTFNFNTVDVISLGGVIEAQSGSSGGAITNAWGRLIAVISTTSEGTTTAQRDLRAVTLSYMNRDILAQSGLDLQSILNGNVETQAAGFHASEAPALRELLISSVEGRNN